jgi:cytochrome c-type biogenesis protein CcmH/NrfG
MVEESPSSPAYAALEGELRRDLKAHPDSAPLLYKLGQVLRKENKPKESLEVYAQAPACKSPMQTNSGRSPWTMCC